LEKIIKKIDGINCFVGKCCSYIVILMMFLVIYEVFTRRFLNSPTVWTFEITIMAYGFHFMTEIPFTLKLGGIVNVDLFYNKISKKGKAILDIITYAFFFFPFVGIVFYFSIIYALSSWRQLESSWSVFAPPLYPIKTIIPIVFFLLLLQGVSEILKRILIIKGEK